MDEILYRAVKPVPFIGTATALVTPMNTDTSIDYDSLGEMIDFQVSAGIQALLILGTTGEASTLTEDEKHDLIRFAAKRINGRTHLVVGIGSNSTASAVRLAKFAGENGADSVLAVTPYYNKTSEDGLIRHFTTIADASSVPVILYNIPSRTGIGISSHIYKKLSLHPNIVGVKEASGNLSLIGSVISDCDSNLRVYAGNDSELLPTYSLGGIGIFSVLSNLIPHEVVSICRDLQRSDYGSARKTYLRYHALVQSLFCEVNPIPVKYACGLLGLCSQTVRLPLVSLSEQKQIIIKNELKTLGLIKQTKE